jgi:serine/threonine-protein kinase
VEQQLAGKAAEIKESLVGAEVFGRSPDYDTRQDSVVRTEAAKLRTRLANYYASAGAADPVVIDLPKGGYTPVFREREFVKPSAPTRRFWLAAASVVLILVAVAAPWRIRRQSPPVAMAVLPLNNLSENANDYFADGLTSEIIRNLSIIDGLAVRSQTSSFAFKGKPRNVRDAGKQLEVDYILEGSVLRSGRQLRVNVQLIRVRDDLPLWSGRFDREVADALVIQDEISRGIVNSLRLKFWRGRRRYETSVEAFDLYLRARAVPVQRGLLGYDDSIALFQNVIRKDPSFAPAYSALAEAHAFRSGQFRFDIAAEAASMRAAAETAIELDPLAAEAHDAMAMAQARSAQWAQSEKSFLRALELDPGRSASNSHYAFFLLVPLGRTAEALRQFRIAHQNDPLSPMLRYWLARLLISLGRYSEAAGYFEKLPSDYTDGTTYLPRSA